MAPRRHPLLLLSALALVFASFAIAPRPVAANPAEYIVDTLEDRPFVAGTPYCDDLVQDDCSIRQAIALAGADGMDSRITFSITGLLDLDISTYGSMVIDQPNLIIDAIESFQTSLRVHIDGAGAVDPAFLITTSGVTIRGFSITGFNDSFLSDGAAVILDGPTATNNRIERNYIGIRPDGVTPAGNYYGIRIDNGASQNIINDNLIGGNVNTGVWIENASQNRVEGNGIGIAPGDIDVGNGQAGVVIISTPSNVSSGNTIGGTSSSSVNVISGNGPAGVINRAGVVLRGIGTSGNFIRANRIGLDIGSGPGDGSTAVANSGDGVRIELGASNNQLLGTNSAPLVIGGNSGYGVRIAGAGTTGNLVRGAYIGLNIFRNAPVPNTRGGIRVDTGAADTRIESSSTAFTLIASHSSQPGLSINAATGTSVSGSGTFIGAVPNPQITGAFLDLPNQVGVRVENGAIETQLRLHRVSGNTQAGVQISGSSATELRDSTIVSNGGLGVSVAQSASGTIIATSTISGNTAGGLLLDATSESEVSQSLISNNTGYGLRLSAALTTTISANTIGLDAPRRNPLGNQGPGIELLNTTNTRIVDDNYIAANSGLGLLISGGSAVEVGENRFGLRRDSAQSDQPILSAPNGGTAQIRIADGARDVEIRGNRLAGGATGSDGPAGLLIEGATTQDIKVRSNQIGLQFTVGDEIRTFAHGVGIAVNGVGAAGSISSTVTIGGGNLSDGNLIRHNLGTAIRLTDVFKANIRNNSADQAIAKNGGDGIVLVTTSDGRQIGSQSIEIENNQLVENAGNAIAIRGEPTTPIIADVQVFSNTLITNAGYGIFVGSNVDRASFRGNLLRSNGGPIRLSETTRYNPNTGANPGDPNRPNHDIDPPWVNVGVFTDTLRLRVKDNGVIEGYVITSTNILLEGAPPASACVTCTLQIFRPFTPEPANLGQGGLLVESSQFDGNFEGSFSADLITGFFSRQLAVNPASIPELLLIATDGFHKGNSSEYATFPISRGLVFEQPPDPGTVGTPLIISQPAAPGAVLTYTMQLRNPGSLTLTSVNLSASAPPSTDWRIVTDPPLGLLPFELEDGQTFPVTVTLTLPTGSKPTVRAGLTQAITLTASSALDATVRAEARLEARIQARPVLSLTPLTSTRSARPGNTTDHLHVVRNDGNITVTVNLAAVTRDNLNLAPSPFWTTTLNKSSMILGPGEEDSLRVTVLVPPGTQEFTEAVTTVTATVPADPTAGYGEITRTATDTTRASLAAAADLSGGTDQEAAAGAVVSFTHTVFNRSNGVADFCLGYTTNKGSTARFVSATDGFVIRADGCFTLDTVNDEGAGRFRDAEFRVIVNVSPLLLPGELETINIELREGSQDGNLIGDATATNTVRITRALVQPRIWLPLVQR